MAKSRPGPPPVEVYHWPKRFQVREAVLLRMPHLQGLTDGTLKRPQLGVLNQAGCVIDVRPLALEEIGHVG